MITYKYLILAEAAIDACSTYALWNEISNYLKD